MGFQRPCRLALACAAPWWNIAAMRKLSLMVLVTAAVAAATSASSAAVAGASSVTVTPSGAKAGTTGAVTVAGATCTSAGFAATWGSAAGPPYTISSNVQLTFRTCNRSGVALTTTCSASGVLTPTNFTASGVTPLNLTSISCTVQQSASCGATVSGLVSGTFDNGPSELTINATGQRLAVTGSTCALIPNAPATTLTASGGGNVVYAVTPTTSVFFIP